MTTARCNETNGIKRRNGTNGPVNRKPQQHRDNQRAKAWERLRDCLLRFRADGDERKAIRLRRSDADIRAVKRTASHLIADFCGCPRDKAHLATTGQLQALCNRLDGAAGVDFQTGKLIERRDV